jgi:hypothetical protein
VVGEDFCHSNEVFEEAEGLVHSRSFTILDAL